MILRLIAEGLKLDLAVTMAEDLSSQPSAPRVLMIRCSRDKLKLNGTNGVGLVSDRSDIETAGSGQATGGGYQSAKPSEARETEKRVSPRSRQLATAGSRELIAVAWPTIARCARSPPEELGVFAGRCARGSG